MFFTILLLLVGTVIFLILSPDQIPVHMSISGEVDRVGSKFEYLVFPAIGAGLGLFFSILAKLERKKTEKSNEKILMYVGIGVIALLALIGFYFMFQASRYDSESNGSLGDANKLINVGIGVLLVVLGNIMPKARMNSMFGIRTSWSMSSDSVWQKTQRFGGITCVICGLLMILLALFIPGELNIYVMLGIIAVMAIVTSAASYKYYVADQKKG